MLYTLSLIEWNCAPIFFKNRAICRSCVAIALADLRTALSRRVFSYLRWRRDLAHEPCPDSLPLLMPPRTSEAEETSPHNCKGTAHQEPGGCCSSDGQNSRIWFGSLTFLWKGCMYFSMKATMPLRVGRACASGDKARSPFKASEPLWYSTLLNVVLITFCTEARLKTNPIGEASGATTILVLPWPASSVTLTANINLTWSNNPSRITPQLAFRLNQQHRCVVVTTIGCFCLQSQNFRKQLFFTALRHGFSLWVPLKYVRVKTMRPVHKRVESA